MSSSRSEVNSEEALRLACKASEKKSENSESKVSLKRLNISLKNLTSLDTIGLNRHLRKGGKASRCWPLLPCLQRSTVFQVYPLTLAEWVSRRAHRQLLVYRF